jgi:uncharacterized protein YndB with AHSA1/START domain
LDVSSSPDESQAVSNVVPLGRPPVRQAVHVRGELEHTFKTFVGRMRAWWPVDPFSAGKQRVKQITLEPREGGRVYETWDDGTTVDWGELLVWDPPNRLVMTWSETPRPTEVELSFTVLGPALTRVTVVHRGWEKLTEEELRRDCALPGGYRSGGYSVGWRQILDRLADAFATRP